MYYSFLIHSFADEHLGCFQYLAIVNCAAMNIGVHRLFWAGVSGFVERWGENHRSACVCLLLAGLGSELCGAGLHCWVQQNLRLDLSDVDHEDMMIQ